MDEHIIYAAGFTQAMSHCIQKLKKEGFTIVSEPSPAVTHLLLPVPSFAPDGMINGGGNLSTLLTLLPKDIVVIVGNLDRPELDYYSTIDLLQDESYLTANASITAYCAIKVALNQLPVVLEGCPVLVIGWGRIGKCLAKLLYAIGADVHICARKETDLALISALGYNAIPFSKIGPHLPRYHIIFNTVPIMILPEALSNQCCKDCIKIDLASSPGIGGSNVVTARGLPGKLAPEASGRLIANSVLELCFKKEVTP